MQATVFNLQVCLPLHLFSQCRASDVTAFIGKYVSTSAKQAEKAYMDLALSDTTRNDFENGFYRKISGAYYLFAPDKLNRDRLAFGTADGQWHLINALDRDYATAIPLHEYVQSGEAKAREKYLQPSAI